MKSSIHCCMVLFATFFTSAAFGAKFGADTQLPLAAGSKGFLLTKASTQVISSVNKKSSLGFEVATSGQMSLAPILIGDAVATPTWDLNAGQTFVSDGNGNVGQIQNPTSGVPNRVLLYSYNGAECNEIWVYAVDSDGQITTTGNSIIVNLTVSPNFGTAETYEMYSCSSGYEISSVELTLSGEPTGDTAGFSLACTSQSEGYLRVSANGLDGDEVFYSCGGA